MVAAKAMPGAELVLPSPHQPGGTPPAPLPAPFQQFPFKLAFPTALSQHPLKFLLQRRLWQQAGMSKGFLVNMAGRKN